MNKSMNYFSKQTIYTREFRVWHLDFRLGAQKGILIKISGQKQYLWLSNVLFRTPSVKILGPHTKSRGICSWAPGKVEP